MSVVVADPLDALCAFLRSTIGDQLTITPAGLKNIPQGVPAVFRPDMPEGFDQEMPTACVVARPAGGYKQFGQGQLPLADPNIDVTCYGADQQEATKIARTVAVYAKQIVAQRWENAILFAAHVVGGPIPLPDTQTLWPTCWVGLQLVHGELPLE